MKSLPKVSVIIPTYNRAQMLREAIDSVLTQKYPNFELIVVDDGSTDETSALLESFGSALRVIYQPNRGVSAARNRGISAASGSLLAFLDSDDLWLKGKLSAQTDFFLSNPDALICQTEEIWIRNGVRVNPKKIHKKPSGMIFTPSLELCLVSPSAVMMRRNLFDIVGFFDEGLPACEDYDLWLRVSVEFPIMLISTPFVVKRGGHADQLSRSPGLDRYRIESIVKLLNRQTLLPDQYEAAVQALKKKCRVYGNGCLKRGRTEEAAYYFYFGLCQADR